MLASLPNLSLQLLNHDSHNSTRMIPFHDLPSYVSSPRVYSPYPVISVIFSLLWCCKISVTSKIIKCFPFFLFKDATFTVPNELLLSVANSAQILAWLVIWNPNIRNRGFWIKFLSNSLAQNYYKLLCISKIVWLAYRFLQAILLWK